jgi:hypothetical protein
MPDLGISEVIGLIGLLTSGVTTGLSLSNQPGTPKTPTPTPQQVQADALKTRGTQEAALSQQLPGIQDRTGGTLSPEAWLQMAEILSGQAGQSGVGGANQDLLQKLLGKGSSTTSGYNVTAGNATNPSTGGPGLTPAGSSFG